MSKPYRARRRQPNAARPVRRYVRLTAEQDRLLRARADAAGVTVPRLLAEGALAGDSGQLRALYAALDGIAHQLTGIARNVNAVALGVNLGDVREGELLTLAHQDIPAVRELINQTKAALEGR